MRDWTEKDLIGPDGVTRGYPNNVSRRAVLDVEDAIRARFGEAEVIRTREAVLGRPSWDRPPSRGSTAMYGADYRDPAPEPGPTRAEFETSMDEKDTEWREGAYPDGNLDD